jgi:hypothetical protein
MLKNRTELSSAEACTRQYAGDHKPHILTPQRCDLRGVIPACLFDAQLGIGLIPSWKSLSTKEAALNLRIG